MANMQTRGENMPKMLPREENAPNMLSRGENVPNIFLGGRMCIICSPGGECAKDTP